jgi:DNA (cytosine-5)-methyltransferase 1
MNKYSDVRKQLGLNQVRYFNEIHAQITHFLQTPEHYKSPFYSNVISVSENAEENLVKEDFNLKLPLKWDVPFPPPQKPKYTFIDLFAGIGGMRIAHQNAGGKCIFSSEWDKFARITYELNFGEVPFGDITKIDESFIPKHDVLVGGFPCQPFSIAGVSKKNSLGRNHGFLDETQGTLFFDVARIIDAKRPKAFMLENVKNLKTHDKGKTFKVIENTLKNLNYNLHVQILDGKYFVPQHRERILIIGFDKNVFNGEENFSFPEMPKEKKVFSSILEPNPDSKYTLTPKLWNYLQDYAKKHKEKGNGFGFGLTDLNGISRTISARYYKDGSEVLIPQEMGMNPRRLTPRECARLQGYENTFQIPVSDNQAYKQFGNSVVVPLMGAVAEQIINTLQNYEVRKS